MTAVLLQESGYDTGLFQCLEEQCWDKPDEPPEADKYYQAEYTKAQYEAHVNNRCHHC